jgi:hypothetical protein
MIKRIWMSIAIFILAFIGLQGINKSDDGCINLYVDYGQLDSGTKLTKCIDASTKTIALDVLKGASLEIEGTKKYGLGVVCRVNNLPDAKTESCEIMPPAEAYWAIIIKEKQVIPFPRKEWGWGQLAVDQQYLNPGDSIGLVWTGPRGELKFP